MSATLSRSLRQGVEALGLNLDDAQQKQLLAYLALLGKWNRVYNLTAVRDPQEMLTHHILDSLALISPLRQHTQGQPLRLLDVGSGGGLPGVVIAIACPEISVHCVDAVAKKAAFIQHAAGELGLPHLRGLHSRVENLAGPYELIVSRAFASLADFTRWSEKSLAGQGIWLAMKGKYPQEEVQALPAHIQVFQHQELKVPGLNARRCLLWMRRV